MEQKSKGGILVKILKWIQLVIFCIPFLFLIVSFILSIMLPGISVRGFSISYTICGMIGTLILYFCIEIIQKKTKKIRAIASCSILIIVYVFLCSSVLSFGKLLKSDVKYHEIQIENLSYEYKIFVYEYKALPGRSGCLCIEINPWMYKIIPGSSYGTEGRFSPIEEQAFFVNYDEVSNELNIRYKVHQEGKFETIFIDFKP